MAAIGFRSFNITGDGEPEKVQAYAATSNFFPLLGTAPLLGRNFLPEEDQEGGAKVAILSYGLWKRRYGGDSAIIGKNILLNGEQHTVIGVMPASFRFLHGLTSLWVPAAFTAQQRLQRSNQHLNVIAKLKPSATLEQAQADIGAITQRIVRDYPNEVSAGLRPAVIPMREQISGASRGPLTMLLVAVGFVLLIACANAANLLLSRAAARRREIAVRAAVGASRGRIVRQLLTESLLLSLSAGALGLLVATTSFEFLKKLVPAGLIDTTLKLDMRVLGFAVIVSVATGIVFGLVPALQASRVDLNEVLKQGEGRSGLRAGGRLRSVLIVTEVALALVLLVGAGLLVQTLSHLRGQYSTLQPESLLTVRTVLQGKYQQPAKRWAFYDEVLTRTKALPGVVSVGYTTSVPLQWPGGSNGFLIEGVDTPVNEAPNALHRQISTEYFQTIGVALREGRYFDQRDDEKSQPVLIINETLARKYWPGQSPLGKRIKFGQDNVPWITIVAVVADVRQMGMSAPTRAEMYLPYRQVEGFPFYKPRDLVIRTTGDPLQLVSAVIREIHAVDRDQPVSNVASLDQLLDQGTQSRRVGMLLLVAFAALSLLLAVIGIYAVLAFFVTQHRPEIGVRLALGAQQRDILGLVLKKGMRLTLIGVALGLIGAFVLTRLMASLLFGVSASDPITFAAIALILTSVALLACYLPARRATKVDPLVALRYE
jgi:putative ABC transport system permease protein